MEFDESTINDGELLNEFFVDYVSVKYVHFQWVDFSGSATRSDGHKTWLHNVIRGFARSLPAAQNSMIVSISTTPQTFFKTPEVWEWRPDWTSIKLCGFAIEQVSVMCFMNQKHASSPIARYPRIFLHSIVIDFSNNVRLRYL